MASVPFGPEFLASGAFRGTEIPGANELTVRGRSPSGSSHNQPSRIPYRRVLPGIEPSGFAARTSQ